MAKLPAKLPHLTGAMSLTGPRGMCFHRSVGLVLDYPAAVLCVGTFRAATEEERRAMPDASPVPFLHAWAEVGDTAFSPTTIERMNGKLLAMPARDYRAVNGARDVRVLRRADLLNLSRRHGLAKHLTHHVPLNDGASFGDVILRGMGIAYGFAADGGLVPA